MTRWGQAAAEKQLKVMVEAILVAERVRRKKESVRRGGREGGSEGGSTDSKWKGQGREHRYSGMETGDVQVGG